MSPNQLLSDLDNVKSYMQFSPTKIDQILASTSDTQSAIHLNVRCEDKKMKSRQHEDMPTYLDSFCTYDPQGNVYFDALRFT